MHPESMKVSVILTVLNESKTIGPLLDSILAQSYMPDEIIVIDGGSSDDTHNILRGYCKNNTIIKFYVENGVNIAQGRNIAIEHACGEIIAVTDAGCKPDIKWLEMLVAPFLSDHPIDAVAGKISVDAQNIYEYYCGQLSLPAMDDNSQSNMFYGRSSAFTKILWERVGGYPEWLYTAEDTLFSMASIRHGFKTIYNPESILYWRPRSNLVKTAKMFFLYGRGNGHINHGSLKASLYWLRYHFIWIVTFFLGFAFPIMWLVTIAVLIYLHTVMILPNIKKSRKQTSKDWAWFYITLIVYTRNIATNTGFIVGNLTYKYNNDYRTNLSNYLSETIIRN